MTILRRQFYCGKETDFFKKVNDNYGHDCGDEVLKNIGALLKKEMQGGDFAARWGGEEFLLAFLDCNGDEAYIKLEQIQRKISAMKVCRGEGCDNFLISVCFFR